MQTKSCIGLASPIQSYISFTRICVRATRALDSPACGLRLPPTLRFTGLPGKFSDAAYLSSSVRISWSTTSCMQRPKARAQARHANEPFPAGRKLSFKDGHKKFKKKVLESCLHKSTLGMILGISSLRLNEDGRNFGNKLS